MPVEDAGDLGIELGPVDREPLAWGAGREHARQPCAVMSLAGEEPGLAGMFHPSGEVDGDAGDATVLADLDVTCVHAGADGDPDPFEPLDHSGAAVDRL